MANNFILAGCDTDAIMFLKPDGKPFSDEEQKNLIKDLNKVYGGGIEFDNEGLFETVICWRSKNYYMKGNKKGKEYKVYKGSSIKDQKKEPALKEFLFKILASMENNSKVNLDEIISIYHEYVSECIYVKDIKRWAQKKTVSKNILNSKDGRKNERDVLEAIEGKGYVEGDKVYVYRKQDGYKQEMKKGVPTVYKNGEPKLVPNFVLGIADEWDNDHLPLFLIERVYKTLEIFSTLIDMNQIPRYHKKMDQENLNNFMETLQ